MPTLSPLLPSPHLLNVAFSLPNAPPSPLPSLPWSRSSPLHLNAATRSSSLRSLSRAPLLLLPLARTPSSLPPLDCIVSPLVRHPCYHPSLVRCRCFRPFFVRGCRVSPSLASRHHVPPSCVRLCCSPFPSLQRPLRRAHQRVVYRLLLHLPPMRSPTVPALIQHHRQSLLA
jgi:hypothetical protein